MNIWIQLFGKKSPITQTLNNIDAQVAAAVRGNPTLNATVTQLGTDLKAGAVVATQAADTALGSLIANDLPAIESVLDGLLIKAGGAVAGPAGALLATTAAGVTPLVNDAVQTVATNVKGLVDAWTLKVAAQLAPTPQSTPAPPSQPGPAS